MTSRQPRTRRSSDSHDDMTSDSSLDYSSCSSSEKESLHNQRPRARRPPSASALIVSLHPGQPRSLSGVALRAFVLGVVASASLCLVTLLLCFRSTTTTGTAGHDDYNDKISTSPVWRVPFFLFALSVFHFLEFWTTARRNTLVATTDSFLLTANGLAYAVAHAAALVECVIVSVWFPRRRWATGIVAAYFPHYLQQQGHLVDAVLLGTGLLLVFVGQAVRSAAMLQAGPSFNHRIQWSRADSHRLVTDGIYGLLRHPSYFGFFYWALGTQLALGNAFCFLAYLAALWSFFSRRIRVEEGRLVEFFKDDYVRYRARVGTWIPFV